LEYKYLPGNKISYNVVSNLYNGKFEKYVIQQPVGFGGIGTFLLTADNSGVTAYNLHAKTYLIVGTTSRFEDYEKDGEIRTGCFWIGGGN
jgi:hypothetical protein